MPDQDSPYEVDAETRKIVEPEICRWVDAAIAGAEARNSQLQIWRDQLEGFGVTAANKSWTNASDFYDSVSLRSFLTVTSQIMSALHRDPKVAVEAFNKADEENARVIESWLSVESSRCDIDSRLYEMVYDACWSQAVVVYVGWKQKVRTVRDVGWKRKGDERVYSEEEKEDDAEYEPVPVAEQVVDEGFDIRVVDLSDFYLYPANAQSVDSATAIVERMLLTEHDLYAGIDDFGYDKDAVEDLCALGPTQEPDGLQIRNAQDGVEGAEGSQGYYEVFTVYSKMPRSVPGATEEIPEHYEDDDFLLVCVPARQIVLKMAFCPYKRRPYYAGGILPKKQTILGMSLMGVLEAIQDEMTANAQFGIDMQNLTATPCLKGPKSEEDNVRKAKLQPGSYMGLNDPEKVEPVEWDRAPLRDMLGLQQWLDQQAQGLVSAQGQGQLQTKSRKNQEVQAVETAASTKFGMYLSNFQRTVVTPLFERMIELKHQFGDVDDDGEDFVDGEGHSQNLSAAALKGKYSIVAVGTSLTHSPEARIEVNKQKAAVQAAYLQAKMANMPPDVLKLVWHMSREQLFDLGDRNPEAVIGEEPKEQEGQPQQQVPPEGAPPQQGGIQPQFNQGVQQ